MGGSQVSQGLQASLPDDGQAVKIGGGPSGPLAVWEQDKASIRVGVLQDDSLLLLSVLEDVLDPLESPEMFSLDVGQAHSLIQLRALQDQVAELCSGQGGDQHSIVAGAVVGIAVVGIAVVVVVGIAVVVVVIVVVEVVVVEVAVVVVVVVVILLQALHNRMMLSDRILPRAVWFIQD